MLSVKSKEMPDPVNACQITLAIPMKVVDQNVFWIVIVHLIRPVKIKNVRTPALVYVDNMLNARLLTI